MLMRILQGAVVAAGLMVSVPATAAPVYKITEIGPLPGYQHSSGRALNDNGQVVGESLYSDPVLGGVHRAFMWSGGVLTDLGALSEHDGYSFSQATAINNSGQVVGISEPSTGGIHPFLWESGVMTDISDDGGSSFAYGINENGQVVGLTAPSSGFVWQSGTFTDLGDLPGGDEYSNAAAINDNGQVAGTSKIGTVNDGYRAFLWDSGVMTSLGKLPGGDDVSQAFAINNSGQVVGTSGAGTGFHAFLWQDGIGMIDLGDLPGGSEFAIALGINDSGQVVGYSDGGAGYVPFLWDEDFGMLDMNDLLVDPTGWHLDYAFGINASGQIVGSGSYNGAGRAFLLTRVVPEPITLSLLSGGLIGIGALRRRMQTDTSVVRNTLTR